MSQTVKKTYRLDADIVDKLVNLAESEGTTETEIVKRAIREYGNDADGCRTSSGGDSKLIEKQLEIKDQQIAELMRQFGDMQRLLDQEQQLHFKNTSRESDSKVLALEEKGTEKRSFLQKLFGD